MKNRERKAGNDIQHADAVQEQVNNTHDNRCVRSPSYNGEFRQSVERSITEREKSSCKPSVAARGGTPFLVRPHKFITK